jgi:hypothetical protein
MRSSWLCAVLVGGAALLSLSACSDSTDVGLGVGPDSLSGGQPVTLNVAPTLDTTRTPPVTGENRRQTFRDAWRFLVGKVDDPLTGEIEADGYIDFGQPSSLPSEISSTDDADSLTAELRLTPNYLHGDSADAIAVEVYELTEEADMDSARANDSFDANEMEPVSVDMAQIVPTDSAVSIELQQSWIDENLSTLKDTSFEEKFPGFKLMAPNSQAVVGFSAFDATLRLTYSSESDTVSADYPGLKSFTHIEQRSAGTSPETHVLLQGGLGTTLEMEWAYGEEELSEEEERTGSVDSLLISPLNRAEIFVPVDTNKMGEYPGTSASFVRPRPQGFRVTALRESSAPNCRTIFRRVGLATGDRSCELPLRPSAAPGAALVPGSPPSGPAFTVFEKSFQRIRSSDGDSEPPLFTVFRVSIFDKETPTASASGLPSTVPILIQRPSSDMPGEIGPPRASLTVTPL